MKAMTYTQVRKNFASAMDEVCNDHSPIIITRQNRSPVVVISLEDYSSIEETLYLMKSSKNYSRLLESIENINNQKSNSRDLIEEY